MSKKYLIFCFIFLISISFFGLTKTADAAVLSRAPNNLSLVGYWPMNEGAGTQAGDMSGSGKHGTLASGPTWTTGKYSQAVNFDGSDDVISTPLVIPTQTFTVAMWIKGNSPDNDILFSQDSTGSADIGFLYNSAGTKFAYQNTAGGASVGRDYTLDSNWHHVVLVDPGTANNDDAKLYIDGVLISTTDTGTASNPSNTTFYIGGRSDGSADWSGRIDDARVYSRALTAAQVLALYKSGAVRVNASSADLDNGSTLESGLVGLWTLDGKDVPWTSATAGTATDRSGQGNTGTLTNMSQATSPTIGKLGQALKFATSNQYVNTGSDFIGTNPTTACTWINPKTDANNGFFVVNGRFLFRFSSSNRFEVYSDGVTHADSAVNALPFNTWTFICATRNSSGTANLYANGVLTGTANQSSGTPAAGTFNVRIGGNGASQSLDGILDDVRIYNRVLSVSEIKQLYKLGQAKINSSQNVTGGSLDTGLVGLWSFNGADINWGSNTAYDRSGSGNNGAITNMSTSSSPAIGKVGQGLMFDGVDDYVTAPEQNSSLAIGTAATFSAWFKPTAVPAVAGQIMRKTGGAEDKSLFWRSNSKVSCYMAGAFSTDLYTSSTLTLGQWYHVTCVYNGTNAYIYVNGVQDNTAAASGNVSDSASPFTIGGPNDSLYFTGAIDEVRYYNRALTAGEVKQLYDMGR